VVPPPARRVPATSVAAQSPPAPYPLARPGPPPRHSGPQTLHDRQDTPWSGICGIRSLPGPGKPKIISGFPCGQGSQAERPYRGWPTDLPFAARGGDDLANDDANAVGSARPTVVGHPDCREVVPSPAGGAGPGHHPTASPGRTGTRPRHARSRFIVRAARRARQGRSQAPGRQPGAFLACFASRYQPPQMFLPVQQVKTAFHLGQRL